MTLRRTLVLGGPGAGKTERLLRVMEDALATGVPPSRIAFVTFTRSAAGEARRRAQERFGATDDDLPYFRTLHSLAFRELGLRRSDVLAEEHLEEVGDVTGELDLAGPTAEVEGPVSRRQADALLTVDHFARTTGIGLREAWQVHGGDLDWWRLKRFSDAYEVYKTDRGLLDFTDLLTEFGRRGGQAPVDVAIIDEAQDLTRAQWLVAERAFAGARELWAAGDDDQCQPAATRVETRDRGAVPIADVRVGERVKSYDRPGGALTASVVTAKSERPYTGRLYKIEVDGRKSRCTATHRWLVRWKEEARRAGYFITYLMRRGDRWRVGYCQLFRYDRTFHLNNRANSERADAAWILKLHKTRQDAYIYEQLVSARYGIPQTVFHPSAEHTQYVIDGVYDDINSEFGGLHALADHNLSAEHPFIDKLKQNYSRYGSVLNEVVACNLLPEFMLMPLPDYKTRQLVWRPFSVSSVKVRKIPVFSLAVAFTKTYVADGILTHNSIHRWAGAAEQHFQGLGWPREVLPMSHRLPEPIFDLAGTVINQVRRRYAKDWTPSGRTGQVEWVRDPEEADLGSGTWLLLARTRAQLVPLVQLARDQGVTYALKGRSSVSWSDVRAIQGYEALRAGRRVDGAEASAALRAMGLKWEFDEERSWTAAELGADCRPIWHDALVRLPLETREYYLACLRRGESLTKPPRVRIDTMHGAKGAEAERVLLLTDLTWRTQRGYELDPDSEHRVFYVGLTRASQQLILVAPRTAYGYPVP